MNTRINDTIVPIYEVNSEYSRSILLVEKADKYTDETPAVRVEMGYTEDPVATVFTDENVKLGSYLKFGGAYEAVEDGLYIEHIKDELYQFLTEEDVIKINVTLGTKAE